MRTHHSWLHPSTPAGLWSLYLALSFVVSFAAFWILEWADTSREPVPTFFSNPLLSIPLLLAGATATLSALFGLAAIFFKGERSVAVLLSVLLGSLVFIFALSEIVSPH